MSTGKFLSPRSSTSSDGQQRRCSAKCINFSAERFDSAVSGRPKHSLRGWLLDRLHSIFWVEKPIAWCELPLDEKLQPISDMLELLFRRANETGLLKYPKVYLAIPDTVHANTRDSTSHLRALVQEAGLEGFGVGGVSRQPQSKLALRSLYGLSDCFGILRYQPPGYVGLDRDSHEGRIIVNGLADGPLDPDFECESYQGRRIQIVLGIYIDSQSLSFRSMIRDDGFFMLDLGTEKLLWTPGEGETTGSERHWRWVRDELRTFVEAASLDLDALVLSGSEATDASFQSVIRDVFGGNDKIVQAEYARGYQDHIFAAARGASELARNGMCTDFTCCIPNQWCSQSKHCKEFQCFWWDDENGKDEL